MIGGLDVVRSFLLFADRALVDHGQPRVDRGAMSREDLAIDGGRKHHIGTLANPLECRLEGFRRGSETFASDDDKTPTRCKARQGGKHMLAGCLPEPALDMVGRRKRRVHHDDRGHDRAIKPVVDRGGIVIRDDGTGEQVFQQGAAIFRKLIQRQRSTCNLYKDRQHAGARRGLQHQIFGPKPCRLRNDGCERQRR